MASLSGTPRLDFAQERRKGRLRERGVRTPTHPYSVEQEPFQIQPHFIAPVLPGETLISLNDQSRSVSDPILNKLKGWWLEKSYYYVPHSKMSGRSTWYDMHVDYDKDISGIHSTAEAKFYHEADTIDWVSQCLRTVVAAYYRDEDETWNVPAIDNVPLARLSRRNFMNSLLTETAYEALDVTITHQAGSPDFAEAREVVEALDQWEFQSKVEAANWTYEDYLRDQGVFVPDRVTRTSTGGGDFVPERLMTVIDWSFPTNTVDETDGSVTSAVIWSPKVRVKDKFFAEPGFVFGVTVVRPKVYFKNQTSTATALLDSAKAWLPALLEDNPDSTILKVAAGKPPYSNMAGATVLDIKDLFLHGEQFINHTIAAADNAVTIPETDADRDYAVVADLDALFVTPAGSNLIRTDGRVSLRVRSSIKETSGPT